MLRTWTLCFLLLQAVAILSQPDTLTYFDRSRERSVPVALYHRGPITSDQQLVLLSHGYGENQPGSYRAYSYLADALAEAGYLVVSIQHELPTDEPLDFNGPARVVRMPNWKRGVENIRFVMNEVRKRHPELTYAPVTLVGHSNGGDMSILFAHEHPEAIAKVITLDHRRMPILRAETPRTYTLRSTDQPADEGVLPTEDEARRHLIHVVQLEDTPHNNMDDDADPRQRAEIIAHVLSFLQEP